MKHAIIYGLALVLLTACQKNDTRYTQQSPEIETVKTLVKNYNNRTYDRNLYAKSSQTFYNTRNDSLTAEETIAYHKRRDPLYKERGFNSENQEYEMVITDDGKTWVNCWLEWKGVMAENEKKVTFPVHLTYQFVDGKIVREVGLWDPTVINTALKEISDNRNRNIEEKSAYEAIETVTTAWNTNDKKLMASVMTANFTRTENGNIIIKNPTDYGTNLMDVYFAAFPDFRVILNHAIIIENKIHID